MSFSVTKTERIQCRTPSQRAAPSAAPIELQGHLLHPSKLVRWLGYWFTPAQTSTYHFKHRLALAQAILSFVKSLSSPGVGVRLFRGYRIASGLLLPIRSYGADLHTPNYAALRVMKSLWHRVQRWTTNKFFSTPNSILSCAAFLPPIISYCRYSRRLTALRVASPRKPTQPQPDSCSPSPSSLPSGPRTLRGTLRKDSPLFISLLTGEPKSPLRQ